MGSSLPIWVRIQSEVRVYERDMGVDVRVLDPAEVNASTTLHLEKAFDIIRGSIVAERLCAYATSSRILQPLGFRLEWNSHHRKLGTGSPGVTTAGLGT